LLANRPPFIAYQHVAKLCHGKCCLSMAKDVNSDYMMKTGSAYCAISFASRRIHATRTATAFAIPYQRYFDFITNIHILLHHLNTLLLLTPLISHSKPRFLQLLNLLCQPYIPTTLHPRTNERRNIVKPDSTNQSHAHQLAKHAPRQARCPTTSLDTGTLDGSGARDASDAKKEKQSGLLRPWHCRLSQQKVERKRNKEC
jgi:hypothetical protein